MTPESAPKIDLSSIKDHSKKSISEKLKEQVREYVQLLRIRQWYKNLVIFLAIFFVEGLFDRGYILITFFGFLSLCLASSGNYILNDIIDAKKDCTHPEKKNRPIASGKISVISGLISASILIILSLSLAYALSRTFLYCVLLLLLLSQLYTLYLKHIIFADILTIATLFVIRSVSGTFLINVSISPWLVLCPFFLSLFLVVGKRHCDLSLLKEKAPRTREVLKEYSLELTNYLIVISTTLLLISYALYSFLSEHRYLIFTLPFALFVIFRVYLLIQQGSAIARNPEKLILDKPFLFGSLLYGIVTFLVIYLPILI